jgi:hypothetical protein
MACFSGRAINQNPLAPFGTAHAFMDRHDRMIDPATNNTTHLGEQR